MDGPLTLGVTVAVTVTTTNGQLTAPVHEKVMVPLFGPAESDAAFTVTLRDCGEVVAVPLAGLTLIQEFAFVVN